MRRISMLLYADDMVLFAQSWAGLQCFLATLDEVCSGLGMAINASKTKVMCMADVAAGLEEFGAFHVAGGVAEVVPNFKYLGSHVQENSSIDSEISMRIASAAGAFRRLQHVWKHPHLKLNMKIRVYKTCVVPVLLFAAEAWPRLTTFQMHRIEVFQNDCLRTIMGVRRSDRHHVKHLRSTCGVVPMEAQVRAHRLRWLGHWFRMPPSRLPRLSCALAGHLLAADGSVPTRRRGRPRFAWDTLLLVEDLGYIMAPGGEAATLQHCSDRGVWRAMLRQLTHPS
jgi:hypothetical protein